ncbi:MAG: hypothetical protein A3E78_11830 [Alphaproteobacteria bacterium RIFCSPHIGHO2_12_FULL_63_12]|nr:MAG: hypothetical protein A3E78_11830 [Alphaproteobacteria bacterium RIFCSPHIGHO2_12_FULL_63_12]
MNPEPSVIIALAIAGLIVLPLALYLWVLPIIIANRRMHPQKTPITVLALFGGVFMPLWIGALAWALAVPAIPKQPRADGQKPMSPALIAILMAAIILGGIVGASVLYSLFKSDPPTTEQTSLSPSTTATDQAEQHAWVADDIKERCATLSPDNYMLQEACITGERGAYKALIDAVSGFPPGSKEVEIGNRCANQFGSAQALIRSWEVARACFEQDLAAYQRLQAK